MDEKTSNDHNAYIPSKDLSKIYIAKDHKIYIAQEEPVYGERLGETKPNSRYAWSDTAR